MSDTVEQVILDIQSVCPDVDPNLARLWVRDAGRRTMEARPWSWQLKRSHFVVPGVVDHLNLGATVTTVQGSDEITFSSNVASEAYVGRQFRVSTTQPIYDITGYVAANKLRIYPAWSPAAVTASGFSIFQNRLALPHDAVELISVVSPLNRWQLWLGVSQEVLDSFDTDRGRSPSNPSLLSPLDYSMEFNGSIDDVLLVSGSGPKPLASGAFTGQSNALYTVQVTTGGVGGTAVFKWRKNEDAFVTGVTTDPSMGNFLSDGVSLMFPAASTFVINDIFVIRATALSNPGVPRMELYPYPSAETVLPYLYIARYPDLTEPNVSIPGGLGQRGDVLREKVLEWASRWPGTEDRPNSYYQINGRDYHAANWAVQMDELFRSDNALFLRSVQPARTLPYAPWPFNGGRNLQEYDPAYMYENAGFFGN